MRKDEMLSSLLILHFKILYCCFFIDLGFKRSSKLGLNVFVSLRLKLRRCLALITFRLPLRFFKCYCFSVIHKMDSCQKRLAKEFQQLILEPPAGVRIVNDSASDLRLWMVHVDGAPNTLYAGEQFTLRVSFGQVFWNLFVICYSCVSKCPFVFASGKQTSFFSFEKAG